MTSVSLDAYVLDTLMADLVGHDRQPSAFLVYLYLWRQTHGRGTADVQVSLIDISTGTGLSKRSVQEALRLLARRRLLTVQREGITAVPVYEVLRPGTAARPPTEVRARARPRPARRAGGLRSASEGLNRGSV